MWSELIVSQLTSIIEFGDCKLKDTILGVIHV